MCNVLNFKGNEVCLIYYVGIIEYASIYPYEIVLEKIKKL
jgi:hypothetical protein